MRFRYIFAMIMSVALLPWLGAMGCVLARGRRVSKCPSCRSDRIRLSWPRPADKLMGLLMVTPYRCEACMKRFFVLAPKKTASAR